MRSVFLLSFTTIQFLLLPSIQSFGQNWERELYIKNISTVQGLSNPTVNCFHQDTRGFIWIGTVDGLNRYDGYEFRSYRNDPLDSNSIAGNRINALCEDTNFNLWIGTASGLCKFNYRSEEFINYSSGNAANPIFAVTYDRHNNLVWFISSNGELNYYAIDSDSVMTYDMKGYLDNIGHRLLIIDHDLYLGTANNGLYKISLDSFQIQEFSNSNGGKFQIPDNWINALHHFDDHLFIGTEKGIITYGLVDESTKYYQTQNSKLPSNSVYWITSNRKGDVYIATPFGIGILDFKTGLISSYQKREDISTTLSANLIRTVFVDDRDNLWIGTVDAGIDFLSQESSVMTTVEKRLGHENSLSGNSITALAHDRKGGFWIGTKENGLNYYSNGKYKVYDRFESTGKSNNYNITDVVIDGFGVVWVAVYNSGLYAFRNGKFERLREDEASPNALRSNRIRAMDFGRDGILWMATENGLVSLDPTSRIFSLHRVREETRSGSFRKNIRTVLVDKEGDVFAGTNSGLYIYNPSSSQVDFYQADVNDSNAIGHNTIIALLQDSKERIWIGTMGGGLSRFDKAKKVFYNYTTADGFPDNSIKSIEEDEEGNLWMGTNKGIVKLLPEEKQIVTFGQSVGLQNDVFNINASARLNDGRLAFGGPNGVNVFLPEEMKTDSKDLKVVLTDLKLFNESITVLDEPEIVAQDISFVQSLEVQHQYSKHFSLHFSALRFSDPLEVQYQYQLRGFDNNWYFLGNENYVVFTNLVPGDYVFNVRASTNGKWENEATSLEIRIVPPWYMTLWFKVSFALLVIALLVFIYFYRGYLFRKRQEILERLVDKKNKEISAQNEELQSINEELISQNEEVVKQKDFINSQNLQLTKVQDELKIVNLTLEEKIKIRTQELEESNKTLDKAVKELDRFVYSASHDLSAPLKSILGLVNIAKLEDKDKNLQVHLDYIERSIIKQENVIKSLTQYSRNARQDIKLESVNIYGIVNQIISDLRYMPGFSEIDMLNNIPEGESIRADEHRLKIIVNNLLSNGVKYRDSDKPDSFVKIEVDVKPKSWQLIVEDNGLGIAKSQIKKIFHMFHRATEESEGSGLGLFIVHEAVDRLGGSIAVESELKIGSKFIIDLPLK